MLILRIIDNFSNSAYLVPPYSVEGWIVSFGTTIIYYAPETGTATTWKYERRQSVELPRAGPAIDESIVR